MSERPKTAVYSKPFDPESGQLMTIEEYLGDVACGGLINDDGMGVPVRDGMEAEVGIDASGCPAWLFPSDGINVIPEDATHVLWFNR